MRMPLVIFALVFGLMAPALAQDVTPLVTAEWLKANAGNANVVTLDIRDKVAETDLGDKPYLANSVVAPYSSAGWRTSIDGVPGKLPNLQDITKLISGLGIDNDDHVVIVPWGTDSTEFGAATRVYWTFKYLGHDAVSILDGGWRQYDAAGGERVASLPKPTPAVFSVSPREELLATTEEVEAALKDGIRLVDGRPAEQYEGTSKSPVVAKAGTIPGSVNLAHSELYLKDQATFVRPETIKALSESLDVSSDKPAITFCNTGHWASITWFGLSEVLGNKNVSMYDGSMAEWTASDARPVVNGAGR
ncbi:MAG: sulfurtransferase [Rhodobiaceae bacterium]|nr:sulfurtransferase [Rhodobiaceae bacterium]